MEGRGRGGRGRGRPTTAERIRREAFAEAAAFAAAEPDEGAIAGEVGDCGAAEVEAVALVPAVAPLLPAAELPAIRVRPEAGRLMCRAEIAPYVREWVRRGRLYDEQQTDGAFEEIMDDAVERIDVRHLSSGVGSHAGLVGEARKSVQMHVRRMAAFLDVLQGEASMEAQIACAAASGACDLVAFVEFSRYDEATSLIWGPPDRRRDGPRERPGRDCHRPPG